MTCIRPPCPPARLGGHGAVSIGSPPVSVAQPQTVSERATDATVEREPGSRVESTAEFLSQVCSAFGEHHHEPLPRTSPGWASDERARGGWVGSPQAGKIKTPVA